MPSKHTASPITLRLSGELRDQLAAYLEASGTVRNQFIADAIAEKLERSQAPGPVAWVSTSKLTVWDGPQIIASWDPEDTGHLIAPDDWPGSYHGVNMDEADYQLEQMGWLMNGDHDWHQDRNAFSVPVIHS
jgi:hypothetical protein